MSTLEVTDHVINYRGGNPNYPTWGLTADGTRIGTVWETERGYAGHIEGDDAEGTHKQYECPELAFRGAVIERLDAKARELGLIP